MTALSHELTAGLRRGRLRPRGAGLRRRSILLELIGAVAWCLVGFHTLIDPVRHAEVRLTIAALRMFGEHGVSGALGDGFIVFGPDPRPLIAVLTPSCSALSSLLALSALALVVLRRRPQALTGLLVATVWIMVANQLRLVLSLLAGRLFGDDALVLFHDWVGAVVNFAYTLIGLLIMVALTMHSPERAEQDRSGRHTAGRPDSWARPGLGYRGAEAADERGGPGQRDGAPSGAGDPDRPAETASGGRDPGRRGETGSGGRGPRIRVTGFVHRRLLPDRVSRRLAARRERRRVDYRLGHLDPAERAAAVTALAARGLGVHTATLIAVATHETDERVLDALADAVATRQWEPISDRQISALRLWARAWLMRTPIAAAPRGPARLVAVTGAGGPAGVAVIRALTAAGERVLALDADPHAVGLRLAERSAVLPRADAPGYGDALRAVVAEHRPAALVCTVAEEYGALAPLAGALADLGCRTWLPSVESAGTCLDKAAFAAALHAAGVPHPPTATTPHGAHALPGPWIVKPAHGRGSRDVMAADTPAELDHALAAVPEPIAQTRLTGREFTADALVGRDGTLLTCVPRWRDQTKAGISVRGTTFDSAAVTRVVGATLRAVGLTGPANVQGFVRDPSPLAGDPDAAVEVTVVEVNPRFSGGLPLTLASGADVVGAYLAGILDPDARLPRLTFRPGVRMARHFSEVYSAPDGSPVADPLVAS